MKRVTSIILAATVICSLGVVSAEKSDDNNKITLIINGEIVEPDVAPFIKNDRILLPMRTVFEELGCCAKYYEKTKTIDVLCGENFVEFFVGDDTMLVNYEEKKIDVAPIIYNDRTLVPIRAVSEAIGADVQWDDDTRTVSIELKQGEHRIRTKSKEKNIRNENGTILMTRSCSYPVIENSEGDSYINEINKYYEINAENCLNDLSESENYTEYLDGTEENFSPVTFDLFFKVNTDKNGIISITNSILYYYGGMHPDSVKESKTFDLNNKRELTLEDVIEGNENECHNMVYNAFLKYLEEHSEMVWPEAVSCLDEECENVNFCLTDNSIILNLPIYSIGPFAMGYPTVELPLSED